MSLVEIVKKPDSVIAAAQTPESRKHFRLNENDSRDIFTEIEDFRLPSGKVFFVYKIDFPIYGRFAGHWTASASIINQKELYEKRRLTLRIKYATGELNRELSMLKNYQPPIEENPGEKKEHKIYEKLKSYRDWLRKAKSLKKLFEKRFDAEIGPYVHQLFRNLSTKSESDYIIASTNQDRPSGFRFGASINNSSIPENVKIYQTNY